MDREYTGGPEPAIDRITRLMRPRGGPYVDGLRLAAINTAGLIVAVLWVAIVTLATRLLDSLLPLPALFTGFFAVLVALGVGAWFWYRHGAQHGAAARQLGIDPKADIYGAIAALPFAGIGATLLGVSVLGLFMATITFSGSRFVDALRELGFAVLFFGVAIANLVISRAAAGGDRGGT